MDNDKFIEEYLVGIREKILWVNKPFIKGMIEVLVKTRLAGGRVFVLGMGGSAANASHMVNDLRKVCGIEAYSPSDNVAELTARANDESFDSIYVEWLKVSNINDRDIIFILSTSGCGENGEKSLPLANVIPWASGCNYILGITGNDNSFLSRWGNIVINIPSLDKDTWVGQAEDIQSIIWHCITYHPDLRKN